MKIEFGIQEDDARNPGVIADCAGDNAGDSVGPTADGFETYGVTGVALISFIMLAIPEPAVQVQLLVWLFAMRVMMIVASGVSYFGNQMLAQQLYADKQRFNFEAPLTSLVWITSIVSLILTFIVSYLLIGNIAVAGRTVPHLWWQLSLIITLRHARRRDHSGGRQGVHVDQLQARPRGGHGVPRGRRQPQHPGRASSPGTSRRSGSAS